MEYSYTTVTYSTSLPDEYRAILVGVMIVGIIMAVLSIIGMWKVFKKAGQPGWASIVPVWNVMKMLEIVGRPAWWILLFFLPFANIVIGAIVLIDLAKSFGKGVGFGVLTLFFPFIMTLILGFGSAQYQGPSVNEAGSTLETPTPPNSAV